MFSDEKVIADLSSNSFRTRQRAKLQIVLRNNFNLYEKLRSHQAEDPNTKRIIEELLREYEERLRSEYKIEIKDYMAYPQIDEGLPHTYQWRGMNKDEIVKHYLNRAISESEFAGVGVSNHCIHHRIATELWMQDRIRFDFIESIVNVKNEKEFREKMGRKIQESQKIMDMLVEGDKLWYDKNKQKSPFEVEKK